MSEPSASGSGSSTPSGSAPKAIASLAKKQSDVTRQGNRALKFVPTLQPRKKKEPSEVKVEPVHHETPPPATRGRGRGRGGGGPPPPRPQLEMTASGPFAMGPAAGPSRRGGAPSNSRVNAATMAATGPPPGSSLIGVSTKREPILNELKGGKGKEKAHDEEEGEVYSDTEDGVEIIDMDRVGEMDWMAPIALQKERKSKKRNKVKIKPELGVANAEEMDLAEAEATGQVDLANALNLSESEEEEEMEDIIDDFASLETDESDIRQDRLYLFQFPKPFPIYARPSAMDVDPPAKTVTFAPGTKTENATKDDEDKSKAPQAPLDGLIGNLEVYKSGAVKMRLASGIVLDVTAATQPTFLQQAVHLDIENKKMNVLGEVNKRFTVSPDIELLLNAMEEAERVTKLPVEGEGELISMDVS